MSPLAEAFTPTVEETVWARDKTTGDQHLLAVWLKSYQRLGYFPKLDEVPPVVVEHLRGLLGVSDDVMLGHDADRTAKWHRGLVCAALDVKYDSARVRMIAEEAIREAVAAENDPADLVNVALEELVRARCELPGFTTLNRMSRRSGRRPTPRCSRRSPRGSTWLGKRGLRGCSGWIRRRGEPSWTG